MHKTNKRTNASFNDSKAQLSDLNYKFEENGDIKMFEKNSENNNKHTHNIPTRNDNNNKLPHFERDKIRHFERDKNSSNLNRSHNSSELNKMKKYKNKNHKTLNPNYMDINNIDLESYMIKGKKKKKILNNNIIKNSNIELNNKLNPALTLVASKAVNGLLDGVHKHMQGPFSLSTDPNGNSPLAPQILTPNLYPNIPNPFNLNNGMPQPTASPISIPVSSPQPSSSQNVPQSIPTQSQVVSNNPQNNIVSTSGQGNTSPNIPMPVTQLTYQQSDNIPNLMSANQIAQNPAFNIHPTATNLRDNPGNVNYNEVVTITIGIVICLFLFCFIFGCLTKMCKPAKRRR
ncbi:hypothetical protein YYC_04624 [Plasmodium yoelii 17X]|uniref:Uncharacterized protein n=1 Tax=Plasmodium yoelii 17X TaxID=1323249 RepID=V7PHL8_PLAYE|nr:hypothetical protein YYC_04624 [Plasmodium yoelii 17X]